MNINKAIDKAYETKFLKEITAAPFDALEGVTSIDTELLTKAFGIKTIHDLGTKKYFMMTQAIAILATKEELFVGTGNDALQRRAAVLALF